MHLVLWSSKAKGEWSFRRPKTASKIKNIVASFAEKYGVRIYSMANVGNHLHFHIQLGSRHGYRPFIRAITASIAMAATGASRWKPLKKSAGDRFWDRRPFTRIIQGFSAFLGLKDYIEINQLEGFGNNRVQAKMLIATEKDRALTGKPSG
jgi:REP element-mobilizing transposase RayT